MTFPKYLLILFSQGLEVLNQKTKYLVIYLKVIPSSAIAVRLTALCLYTTLLTYIPYITKFVHFGGGFRTS